MAPSALPRTGPPIWALVLAFAGAFLVAGRDAAAEPTATERATARRLLFEGRDKLRSGDLAEALTALRAADAIMGVPTTAVDLARAELATGRLVEGSESLRRALRYPTTSATPAPFLEAQRDAEALLAAVTPRIPTLRIVLPGAAGGPDAPAVTLDGRPVPPAALDVPYAVDPGHHVLILSTAKGERIERTVDVLEGRAVVVELSPAGSAHEQALATAPLPGEPVARSPAATAAIVGGAIIAVAGMAVGVGAGIMSATDTAAARSQCQGQQCLAPTYPLLDRAGAEATACDVGLVAAGVGLAVAAMGWLWPRQKVAAAGRAVTVNPSRIAGATGLDMALRW